MYLDVSSARVIPSEQLSDVRLDPSYFGLDASNREPFALMILELETGSIRMIQLDQKKVTKLVIEAEYGNTPKWFMRLASVFESRNISIIYSKHKYMHPKRTKFCVETYIRETDVTALCHDLRKMDGVTKVDSLELCAIPK